MLGERLWSLQVSSQRMPATMKGDKRRRNVEPWSNVTRKRRISSSKRVRQRQPQRQTRKQRMKMRLKMVKPKPTQQRLPFNQSLKKKYQLAKKVTKRQLQLKRKKKRTSIIGKMPSMTSQRDW